MLKNQSKKKMWFYSLIGILLASCLILSVVASVALSQTANQEPTNTPSNETTNISPTPDDNQSDINPATQVSPKQHQIPPTKQSY